MTMRTRGHSRALRRERAKRTLVRQLGPYQLLRKIGSGGMAEVWSARIPGARPEDDRFFAIKVLASHLAEREEYREMFLGEARLSMMLSHPNIVQVYDAVAHEQDCYMVMELISGMTLSQFQRAMMRGGSSLPLTISAYVVGELLRALSYAHQVRTEAGSIIVHRDVSPQNVMVTANGEVKLMDFGIARFASEETQGAFVKGKLQYMPPEQLRKQTRKPTVDLYAVGAILHELLDGRRFRGKLDQAKLLQMVMHGEVPPLRRPEAVPPEIDVVRQGLLEPDEDRRIQSARKALGMLVRWPDYRESANVLRDLVRRYVEPHSVFEVPEGSKISSVPEGSFSGVPQVGGGGEPVAASSDAQLDAAAAAQTEPTGSELTAEEDPDVLSASEVVAVPAPAPRRRGWPFAVAGVVVAAGLGAALMVLGPGERGSEPTEEPAEAPAPPEPAKVAALEQQPKPPGGTGQGGEEQAGTGDELAAAAGTETGGPAGDGEDSGEGEEVEQDDGTGDEGADRVLVPVEFVANEFFFVYVRVGGRVLTLEPRARVQLPEGKHTVYLRQSKDEKWQRAGRIKIEADREYRVEMRQPAGLKLVKK
jgi:serine/threonine protein kinase